MTNKIYLYINVFSKDMCKSCQKKEVRTTKTEFDKLVEKFNRRYGNLK